MASLLENRWQIKGVPNPEKCSEVPPAGLLTREAMLCLCSSAPAAASFEEGGMQPGNKRGVAGGEENRLGRELRKNVRKGRGSFREIGGLFDIPKHSSWFDSVHEMVQSGLREYSASSPEFRVEETEEVFTCFWGVRSWPSRV